MGVRVGSKKVAWVNFREICSMMNRTEDHVTQFVLAEFGTEGSIAGDGQLILRGRYMPKHAESLLRKYIKEFVTCEMCKAEDVRCSCHKYCCGGPGRPAVPIPTLYR